MVSPTLIIPSFTHIKTITPLYGSKALSKIKAFSGASILPVGAGIYIHTCSSISRTPIPVLADANTASNAGIPMTSSISFLVASGSAEGRRVSRKSFGLDLRNVP